ncbi:MAG: SDR family NAD(P)-dependent oxidoreductase [Acidimicrobiales bacterium]
MSRRALVTGVSGGIGQAVARTFVTEGWRVIGFDRITPPDDLLAAIHYTACDLADSDQIRTSIASMVGDEPLDALVNNGALQLNRALSETSDDEWDLVMNTNVRSAFLCMREAHANLVAASGSVVNVSSVHAVATSANVGAYAASKGALVALTRAAAVELAEHGVRCNAVLPGAVDTQMLRDGLGRRPHPDGPAGNLQALIDRTPLRAVADPYEIASSIVFLADGSKSSFITGQAVVIDGGATARLSTE